MEIQMFKQNYFYEIPIDIQKIILDYTIPNPPEYPNPTEKYDFDMINVRQMDYLVNYFPTSYFMRKKYKNIDKLLQYYIDNFIIRMEDVPYSKIYQFNKMVKDFCEEHSTKEFKKNYKIETRNGIKVNQKYINRRGRFY
jgi:hypothetical protein